MYRTLISCTLLATLPMLLIGSSAKAEFIKRVTCQVELVDSQSSDTETASAGFQRWVACVNGR